MEMDGCLDKSKIHFGTGPRDATIKLVLGHVSRTVTFVLDL
jgi:hypothetical protein